MERVEEYFEGLETEREHNGYYYSVGTALTLVILGSLCGLRNVNQIHQWASTAHIAEYLSKHFKISRIPSYYWLLCLLKLIRPQSLNGCFVRWVQSFIPEGLKDLTISFDGKTICSTGKMRKYTEALNIVSAQIAELGITFAQQSVSAKSNEIPAVRELLGMLKIPGCVVVADALHCQKETADAVIAGNADYVLSVKDNQKALKADIQDYVQDSVLQKGMDTFETTQKNRGRLEERRAFTTCDIGRLDGREEWKGLACIGAVHRKTCEKKGNTDEWHYYISSRKLKAQNLLRRARLEWSVETMHWLLDVHFREDFCRVEDKNVQENMNIIRKIALNTIKHYKEKTHSKSPISRIRLECLLDTSNISVLLIHIQN